MKIRKKRDLYLEGQRVKAVVVKNSQKFASEKSEAEIILSFNDIFLNSAAKPAKKNIFSRMGEYEVKDVLIYVLSSKNTDQADLFSVNIDGVNIIYLDNSVNSLASETIDLVGVCHILVAELNHDDLKAKSELVNEIDPYVVIPLSDEPETVHKFATNLGLVEPEAQGYLNYTLSQFENDEEATISLALLK